MPTQRTPIDDDCGPSRLFAPTRSIRLRTSIPGPQSHQMLGTASGSRIVARYAHGVRVIDVDENILLDFANAGTLGLGHTPEVVSAAISDAANRMIGLNDRLVVSQDALRLSDVLRDLFGTHLFPGQPVTVQLFASREDARKQITGSAHDLSLLIRSGGWPDAASGIVVIDELLTAGLPFGAIIGRADQWSPLSSDHHTGYPDALTCAAATAGLHYLIEHDLPTRATQIGDIMREQIALWSANAALGVVGIDAGDTDIEGNRRGNLLSLRLSSVKRAQSVLQMALQNGLLLDTAALADAVIPLNPALMIPEEQLYEGLDVLGYALNAEV